MTDIFVSGNAAPSVSVSGSTVSVSVSSGVGPQGPAGKDGSGGVATLNGLTGALMIESAGGVTATGSKITIGGVGGGASSWDDLTGKPSLVYSVAGRTGTVTLTTADIGGYAAPPVTSVAGRTGAVTISTGDVSGFSAAASAAAPVQSVAGRTGAVTISTSDVSGYTAPPVTSVAGRTGAITLTQSDIGGNNVTALNGITGTPTIVAGANVTVTTAAASITIAAASGGGGSPTGAAGGDLSGSYPNPTLSNSVANSIFHPFLLGGM